MTRLWVVRFPVTKTSLIVTGRSLGDLIDESDPVFRRALDTGDDIAAAEPAVEIERFDLT